MEKKKLKIHPQKNAKIKVYINANKSAYGYYLRTETVFKKMIHQVMEKEVAVLAKSYEAFDFEEIDFCLKDSQVISDGE
jgi:hypothetical protein